MTLTDQQLAILRHLAYGYDCESIARKVNRSERTVRRQLLHLRVVTGCRSNTHLAVWAAVSGHVAAYVPVANPATVRPPARHRHTHDKEGRLRMTTFEYQQNGTLEATVKVAGRDFSGQIGGFTLRHDARQRPYVELDITPEGMTVVGAEHAVVKPSDWLHELLLELGWTPPGEAHLIEARTWRAAADLIEFEEHVDRDRLPQLLRTKAESAVAKNTGQAAP